MGSCLRVSIGVALLLGLAVFEIVVFSTASRPRGWRDVVTSRETRASRSGQEHMATLEAAVSSRNKKQRECSDMCQCTSAGMQPYGRYCGLMYTGCPGAVPCDNLDRCCMLHDSCTGYYGMFDKNCTVALVKCAACAINTANNDPLTTSNWTCGKRKQAGLTIISDVMFLFPQYF